MHYIWLSDLSHPFQFISEPFVTEFEGREFEHYVHYQPIFPVLSQLVGDADLAQHMVYYPEERYVHRPGTAAGSMQVREELWHGKLWWDLQVSSKHDISLSLSL